MKVYCEYCGSYVDAENSLICPCCTAPLGESVRRAREQAKQEELEAQERARQAQLEAQKQAQQEQTKQVITNLVSGLVFGGLMSGTNRYQAPQRPVKLGTQRPPKVPGGFGTGHGPGFGGPGHGPGFGGPGGHTPGGGLGGPGKKRR